MLSAKLAGNNMEQRQEFRVRRCVICSTGRHQVIHRHFSSLWLRQLTGVEAAGSRHICASCKSHHLPYPYSRVKIVVSDSTLHSFFAPPGHTGTQYAGDLMHTDYITIPGADIDTLSNAFRLEYGQNVSRPLDVVLVAGYNDLALERSSREIMRSFQNFADIVLNCGSGTDTNTVAICNMMYPPQIAWFPDDGPLPVNHGGNNLFRIEWINECILALNLDNGITEFPRLHKFGVRNFTRRYTDMYGQEHHRRIKAHRFEHWVEPDPAKKMHLVNEQRFKIGAAVNKYFSLRTTW